MGFYMLITKEEILKDTKANRQVVIYSIYTAVGVLITLFLLYCQEILIWTH